jgi:hypothetical protein
MMSGDRGDEVVGPAERGVDADLVGLRKGFDQRPVIS